MNDLITLLEAPYNLIYGVLGGISVGIWLVSAIGLFSHSAIEGFFPHPDLDTDIDLDVDADADGFSLGEGFMNFLSVGQVPISIILTILFFIQAIIGVWMNQFAINQFELSMSWQLWTMFVVNFGISFLVATFIAGFVLKPIKPFFRDYGIVRTANSLIGKVAVISSSKVTKNFGSAIFKLDGGEIVDLSVRTAEKEDIFVKGQKVVIVDFNDEKNIYSVMLN
ncbi:Protein of unknown function (DUF1449) [Bernardetia litoralis DSM 6794]|uniref:Inner membrane protein YqiJ N-terminal domain-containing protein n=1 Tax=Bernardetia litoralis (strain ATCC 23117 / DSM 6794 / NBRC 15988 / NCIMB 1366 / Fx l1 / Sio-4) TaxID=880071 RepID=I4ANJ2_BERLS|nr:OB-fold-containig protein [Bernardetia litoralis]AFM05527.1 Protein of unknown function (DUF1449) [Bernardetia litoralis DSM 6794]